MRIEVNNVSVVMNSLDELCRKIDVRLDSPETQEHQDFDKSQIIIS